MIFRNWNKILGLLLMLLVGGCVEPYSPDVLEAPNSFLVVNGFINSNGPTTIQLTRTQNLREDTPPPAETNAIVQVESESGESYRLTDKGDGTYTSGDLNLNPPAKYRIYIRTQAGKEYASEFVEVKPTPAIDKVTWAPVGNEVQFYVSTYDPTNSTRYYRWEYEETWQFRSAFFAGIKYENGEVVVRGQLDPNIFDCWKTNRSTTIELGNTLRLNQDVVSNYKLLAIPYTEERLGVKYSMLVKQYALTREAHEYWETLKKNTENIGTLFDPLPSQLHSNIRCITNPEEPVVGYISASTMKEKIVFVQKSELPREWRTFMPTCRTDTLRLADANPSDFFESGKNMPYGQLSDESSGALIGYLYASKYCVDCRETGSNVKPAFWE